MLHAIFEAADLEAKVSTSLASGDWSQWTASELDQIVHEGERADRLIGQIIKRDREIPDNLWEALNRKYSPSELSGSIETYLIDYNDDGKVHLRPDYLDLLDEQSRKRIVSRIYEITRSKNATRWVRKPDGGHQQIPWEISEWHKLIEARDRLDEQRKKASIEKAKATRKANKENASKEGNAGLKPTMTEHWHRWMPDQVPDQDTSWEKLRPLLKTQSKLDIETMLREMEKVGVVSPNEHGSKVFRAARYQEIMGEEKDRFAASHIHDFKGTTLANMQMIRGKAARPALISVGMPLKVENRWKKEHPKLYAFLKQLRDKKQSNHAPVMRGIRPIGWARIDKLDAENWLIEEVQQDIDNVGSENFGEHKYGAQSHLGRAKKYRGEAESHKANVEGYTKALPLMEKLLPIMRQHEQEWRKWEVDNGRNIGQAMEPGGWELVTKDGSTRPRKEHERLPQSFLDAYPLMKEIQGILDKTSRYIPLTEFSRLNDFEHRVKEMREDITNAQADEREANDRADNFQRNHDAGTPESAEHQEWQKDVSAMQEVVAKFPRWAMHAIKQAAKENGVKNLWWVTLTQKIKLGGAKPPRDFTSDKLARKFGFKKVPLVKDPTFQDACYPLAGTGLLGKITLGYSETSTKGILADEDKYLWMAPVSEIVTESARPLDIGVFQ